MINKRWALRESAAWSSEDMIAKTLDAVKRDLAMGLDLDHAVEHAVRNWNMVSTMQRGTELTPEEVAEVRRRAEGGAPRTGVASRRARLLAMLRRAVDSEVLPHMAWHNAELGYRLDAFVQKAPMGHLWRVFLTDPQGREKEFAAVPALRVDRSQTDPEKPGYDETKPFTQGVGAFDTEHVDTLVAKAMSSLGGGFGSGVGAPASWQPIDVGQEKTLKKDRGVVFEDVWHSGKIKDDVIRLLSGSDSEDARSGEPGSYEWGLSFEGSDAENIARQFGIEPRSQGEDEEGEDPDYYKYEVLPDEVCERGTEIVDGLPGKWGLPGQLHFGWYGESGEMALYYTWTDADVEEFRQSGAPKAPQTPDDIVPMDPRAEIDKLLDQYQSITDPAAKAQVEKKIERLRQRGCLRSRWLQRRAKKKSRREKQEAKNPDLRRESDLIRENKKKPEATEPHDFKPAKYTHPNGHPRCLVCGGEERIGGRCCVEPTAADFAEFEKELDAEFPDRAKRRERAEKTAGYKDWSPSFLFDPVENPVPFPVVGQRSGLWGWVYANDEKAKELGTGDLDELLFLVENDSDMYHAFMREFSKKYPEVQEEGPGAAIPVKDHPWVIPFLKKVFDKINREYVYPTWGKASPEPGHEDDPMYQAQSPWKGVAKNVITHLRGIYGDGEQGAVELEKFLSRLRPGEREDFMEEAQSDPLSNILEGFREIIDKQKGAEPRVKPSPKTEMFEENIQDIPTLTPQDIDRKKDEALDRFSSGEITQQQLDQELEKLNRMATVKEHGLRIAANDLLMRFAIGEITYTEFEQRLEKRG